MARLTENIKLHIVQRLACFESLPSVVQSVKDEFGIDVSRQALQAYDPSKSQAKNMSKKLRTIFEETRKRFLEDTSNIPISHKAVRLATLQRMADKAETKGNMVLVKDLLEQAAKEVGESYTNKQKLDHTSSDGSMTPKQTVLDTSKLSTGTLKELLKARAASSE